MVDPLALSPGLNRPPLVPAEPMRTLEGRLLPPGFRVSAFSTEKPRNAALPRSLDTRKLYWRVHTKPASYCASMVDGRISVPRVRPCVVSVTSDQPWPPEKSQPLFVFASAHSWRWRST